jgi:hypothetical protein
MVTMAFIQNHVASESDIHYHYLCEGMGLKMGLLWVTSLGLTRPLYGGAYQWAMSHSTAI